MSQNVTLPAIISAAQSLADQGPRRFPRPFSRVAEAAGSFRLRLTSVSGFPRSWLNIRLPCDRRRLRPLQTGRADFPHPAYPNPLALGMHRESAASRSQEPQAEALQMGIERLAFRGRKGR